MPGPTRRSKTLKQSTDLTDIDQFSSVNPVTGDILIYDSVSGLYENSRSMTGPYSMSGLLTLDDLLITNDVTIQDALAVTGNTNITGDLSVIGAAAFNAAMTVGTTLGVTGAVTLSDTLNVAGLLTGAGLSFAGSGTIVGNLAVNGTLTPGVLDLSAAALNVGLDLTVGGNLTVTGITVLNDDLTVNGNISGGAVGGTSLSSGGALGIGGTFTFPGGSLSVSAPDLTLDNQVNAGKWILTSTTTAAADITLLTLDPDAHHTFGGVDGLVVPIGTTAQEPTGTNGMIRYDSDTTTFRVFKAGAWAEMDTDTILTNFQDNVLIGEILYNATVVGWSHGSGLHMADRAASAGSAAPFMGFYDETGASRIGFIQNAEASSLNTFRIINEVDSNHITLGGNTAASAPVVMANFDPDATIDLYANAGELHAQVTEFGLRNLGRVATDDTFLEFYEDTNTTRYGFVQFSNAAGVAVFESEIDSSIIELTSRNSVSNVRNVFTGDPDGESALLRAAVNAVHLTTDSSGVTVTQPSGNTILTLEDGTDEIGTLRKVDGGLVRLRNHEPGSEVYLEAHDAGDTLRAGAIRAGTASSATAIGFHNTAPIIKQTTTSQTAATFVANTSGIVDDSGTWAGYTMGDVVAILQAYGLLT